jgi:hypothetical protein
MFVCLVWVVDVTRDVRDSWPKQGLASGNGEVSWSSLCVYIYLQICPYVVMGKNYMGIL